MLTLYIADRNVNCYNHMAVSMEASQKINNYHMIQLYESWVYTWMIVSQSDTNIHVYPNMIHNRQYMEPS